MSREGVGRGPALEIDVMMGFVMQTVVREGERRGSCAGEHFPLVEIHLQWMKFEKKMRW